MDWMDNLANLLRQNAGEHPAANLYPTPSPEEIEHHFDYLVRSSAREDLACGLAEVFRSDRTPPFPQMAALLYQNSGLAERAQVVHALMEFVEPASLSELGLTSGSSQSALGAARDNWGQVLPETIQVLAERAEKIDPSVLNRVSSVYADHPELVKTLGTTAVSVLLAQVAKRQAS